MKNQRKIDLIVVHCSATRANQNFPVEALEACHKARGFRSIGYHYYITKDGMVYPCRPENEVGAHARHYNAHSIGICYEGGLDEKGKPADTRTPAQKESLEDLLYSLALDYPDAEILGHRDLPWVRKSCPSFNVKEWLRKSTSISRKCSSSENRWGVFSLFIHIKVYAPSCVSFFTAIWCITIVSPKLFDTDTYGYYRICFTSSTVLFNILAISSSDMPLSCMPLIILRSISSFSFN